jgi:hypothetical protein
MSQEASREKRLILCHFFFFLLRKTFFNVRHSKKKLEMTKLWFCDLLQIWFFSLRKNNKEKVNDSKIQVINEKVYIFTASVGGWYIRSLTQIRMCLFVTHVQTWIGQMSPHDLSIYLVLWFTCIVCRKFRKFLNRKTGCLMCITGAPPHHISHELLFHIVGSIKLNYAFFSVKQHPPTTLLSGTEKNLEVSDPKIRMENRR